MSLARSLALGAVLSAITGLALVTTAWTSPARIDEKPRARVFQKVKIADSGWRGAACVGLEGDCVRDAALYHAPGDAPNAYYVILLSGPTLLGMSLDEDRRWRVTARWSLRDYRSTLLGVASADADPLRLFPALYPLGPNDWAVAVLGRRSELYSGGGANVEVADFVSLKALAASARTARPTYGGVPFSCSTMIRACFSEQDYKTSKHCHDETSGSLTIRYTPAPPGAARHGWTFLWSQIEWPQDTPRSKASREVSALESPPGGLFDPKDAFGFCGGFGD